MLLEDFDYQLPTDLIAQRPLAPRDASRMMVLERAAGTLRDRVFRDLPQVLEPGDLLVFNNTRVFPARLLGRRRGLRSQSIGKRNPAAREFLRGRSRVVADAAGKCGRLEGACPPGPKGAKR